MNDATAQGLGAVLRAAREAAGMSEQQVADTLRLPTAVVRTLEANGFQSLPAPAYARGYVRAYARLLELDAEALLGEHEQCLGGVQTPRLVLTDNGRTPLRDTLHERLGWVFGGAALVVGLVASGVLWWAWPQEGATLVASSVPVPSSAQAAGSPLPAAPSAVATPSPSSTERAAITPRLAAATPVPDATTHDAAAPSTPVADGNAETSVIAVDASAEVAAVSSTEGDIAAAPTLVNGSGRALTFAFSEDCWVEVSDSMDRVIHRALNRAGETLLLHGETPLRIRIGNAPGVTLEYDGHAVALGPHTRNRVANLVLE